MNLDLQRSTLSGNATMGAGSVNGRFACLTPEGATGRILAGREHDTDRLAASKPAFGQACEPLEAALRGKEQILLHIH